MARTVNRAEAQLAYFAAATALGITFDVGELKAMADLTLSLEDIKAAVVEMRQWPVNHDPTARFQAVLKALRTRREIL